VRQVLSQASPRLRQLAALDAVLEQALTRREQMHLPAVTTLMQRRFDALRREHRQAAVAAVPEDNEGAPQAEAWRDTFRKEWTQVLLAELDLRLDPVAGLIDALAHD
jgi:hypothetical protein